MAKKKATPARSSGALWITIGAAVIAVGLLIGASLGASKTGPTKALTAAGAERNALGPADAKVTLIEYGDYL